MFFNKGNFLTKILNLYPTLQSPTLVYPYPPASNPGYRNNLPSIYRHALVRDRHGQYRSLGYLL